MRGSIAMIVPVAVEPSTSVEAVSGIPTSISRICCSGIEKSTRSVSMSCSVA